MNKLSLEIKVGLFAVIVILIAAFVTVKISERAVTAGRGYKLVTVFSNATGLKIKAPVELAGVQVGVVKDIELVDSRQAKVTILLNRKVKLPADSRAVLRTRGFLGQTYVELVPGMAQQEILKPGERIYDTAASGDINQLVNQFNDIAADIKTVTSSLKDLVGRDDTTPINRIVKNLEEFTKSIRDITVTNQQNVNLIADNLAEFTTELRSIIHRGRGDVEDSIANIASITRKIDEGRGTVGRLINDEETVDKLNSAIDNLNETLGGFHKLETEIGYHTEFMTRTHDFKHYVHFALKPAPDKAFLFDIVADPDPPPTQVERTTDVTVNNNTTSVETHTATINRNALRFSAQLAKSFYDFRLRGGIIESTGGLGADYFYGPFAVHVDAYDLTTRYGQKPHIKLGAEVNITKNFFLMGGADDIINPRQPVDYFVGAGFRLIDEDIKRLGYYGATSLIK